MSGPSTRAAAAADWPMPRAPPSLARPPWATRAMRAAVVVLSRPWPAATRPSADEGQDGRGQRHQHQAHRQQHRAADGHRTVAVPVGHRADQAALDHDQDRPDGGEHDPQAGRAEVEPGGAEVGERRLHAGEGEGRGEDGEQDRPQRGALHREPEAGQAALGRGVRLVDRTGPVDRTGLVTTGLAAGPGSPDRAGGPRSGPAAAGLTGTAPALRVAAGTARAPD